ncbi:MAG: hypothetical protein LBI28_12605 [Treponema sp.]|jgi:hypothetical protein|nr:hypothetical protein [Treponema sp.]
MKTASIKSAVKKACKKSAVKKVGYKSKSAAKKTVRKKADGIPLPRPPQGKYRNHRPTQ